MRKEVLLAILAGGIFGLIIAFGIWRLNSSLESTNLSTESTPPPTTVDDSGVTIAKPTDGKVVTDSSIEISGVTKSNSHVIVSSESEDFYSQSDTSGEFSVEVDLDGGLNTLAIFVFDENGLVSETSLEIVYSSEFDKYLVKDEGDENEATESADDVRSKVQEKVKEIQTNSVFFMGTVTDISESTLQIELKSGEIEQASTTEETDYLSETKTRKTIEKEDVAIGDFIIAMGFASGNDVLEAKRIVVTTKPEEIDLLGKIGEVKSTSSKKLVLISDGEETEIAFGKTWKGSDLSELEEGQIVIVVGEESEEFTARSLFLISEASNQEE